MTLYEKMDVTKQYANQSRRRYLTEKLLALQDIRDECLASDDEFDHATAIDLVVTINRMHKQLDALNRIYKEGEITDEMVEQARSVPVDAVIEWTRNRAVAFCHDDHDPSLTRWPREDGKVLAHCFVCNKTFDSIKVLTERDGMTFPQAVRYLCS